MDMHKKFHLAFSNKTCNEPTLQAFLKTMYEILLKINLWTSEVISISTVVTVCNSKSVTYRFYV